MKTVWSKPTPDCLRQAGELLRRGELVAIPTETVYGLAANALDGNAVSGIFRVKGRPQDNPLIVHISSLEQIPQLTKNIPPLVYRLAELFWPGPLTMVLPRSDRVPIEVSAGLDTVGIRFPAHSVAQAVIRAAGVPLAAPSANLSGAPSPTNAKRVWEDLNGKIPLLIDGGECEVGVESTVIAVGEDSVEILRPGKITAEQFQKAGIKVTVNPAVERGLKEGEQAASPGMKYRHYAPKAELLLIQAPLEAFRRYLKENAEEHSYALVFDGEAELMPIPSLTYGGKKVSGDQAHQLFERLRQLDEKNANCVYVRAPTRKGVGLAVYNRLIRASAFRSVTLLSPLVVGLTGPTGSGKTLVSDAMSKRGAYLINADQIAREVVEPEHSSGCLSRLSELFSGILRSNGTLDRGALAEQAFSDPEALEKMNGVCYPAIFDEIVSKIRQSDAPLILLDAPTLFESGCDLLCDLVVSVLAPADVRLKRILLRDGITPQQALSRMGAQHDDRFYTEQSDYLLLNDGSKKAVLDKIDMLADKLFAMVRGESRA